MRRSPAPDDDAGLARMARTRYASPDQETRLRELPFAALRAVLREGYGVRDLRADAMAGLIVGVVALPLAMALAIAVGVPPQAGLYTAVVAGALVAALGGSRVQVSGPTAAFVAILAPVTARFGISGLLVAGLLAGLMLVAMGLFRMGKLIEFIPHPVTTGFTAGIATVIAGLQLKDLLGLRPTRAPEHFLERLHAMWEVRGTASGWELLVGAFTLAILLLLPRLVRRVPAPLVALPAAALLVVLLGALVPGFEVATIASRFHSEVGGRIVPGIPPLPPLPVLPWKAPGAFADGFSLEVIRALLPSAFAIAMLGAIESLLSAVVADGMARTRHDPDAELVALGVGNVIAPFFGGIPATGAIARTATNIRSGARSPLAAVIHALTILAALVVLAPLLGYLPMAALAALLLLVAWNMSEVKLFAHTLRVAPRSDMAVLLTCYGLTVAFDMTIGVTVGMLLAVVLFMRRMAAVTNARFLDEGEHRSLPGPVPPGVLVYDISGPLFFGAAQKAMAALGQIGDRARVVVLRMEGVQAMDATGLVALESALDGLKVQHIAALLCGVQPQPIALLRRAGIPERPGVRIVADDREGLAVAAELAAGSPGRGSGSGPPRAAAVTMPRP
jgi:SulP family sulfate permease